MNKFFSPVFLGFFVAVSVYLCFSQIAAASPKGIPQDIRSNPNKLEKAQRHKGTENTAECGVWSAECRVQSAKKDEVRGTKYEVRSTRHKVRNKSEHGAQAQLALSSWQVETPNLGVCTIENYQITKLPNHLPSSASNNQQLTTNILVDGAATNTLSIIEELGYGDFRGVIHSHSYLSHDSEGTTKRIIQAAQTVGINFILMTDHPSPYSVIHGLRGMHGGIFFLPGAELSRGGGSLLAINIKENIHSNSMSDTIDEIHKQDGLAFLGHIEKFEDWNNANWDGMEIYNLHYDAILDGKIDKTLALIPILEKEPDRVWLSILDKPTLYLKKWDEQLKNRKTPGIAANDSHENVVYNGFQLDTYERSFGLVNTHLFLMELSEAELLNALRTGHGYICFEIFAHCRGFSFTASDGKNIAIMGDDFYIKKNKNQKGENYLSVKLPFDAKIQLLKDGEKIKEEISKGFDFELSTAGIYRIEAYIKYKNKFQPWIYSNPIYVR